MRKNSTPDHENLCNPDLCAVVLAGGASRRMGRNKALIDVGGRPLIVRVAEQALRLTNQIFVSANDDDAYRFLGLPAVHDLYPGQGPLAGLHAAFRRTDRPLILLLACDLPALRGAMLRRLIELSQGYDAVIPQTSDGRFHPLCAVYRRSCLRTLERNLEAGINKMTELFRDQSLRVRWVNSQEGLFDDLDLRNLNTPEDIERYIREARAHPHPSGT